MTEQFEVIEVQNKSRIPYVFDVEDYTENRTPEQAVRACEDAANAKYHDVMVAAYGGNVAYCGAVLLHYVDYNVEMKKSEIKKREAAG